MIKVAFNVQPLKTGHKTRGVGTYTKYLLENLKKKSEVEIEEFENLATVKDVDLVHYPWFDLFFHTLPLKKKFPTVVTIFDTIPLIFPTQHPTGIKGKVNLFLQKLSLKSCKQIITDSQSSKKDISNFLKINPTKVKVIPLAADSSFKVLSDAKKLQVKNEYHLPDKFILYVGDANYTKNLPVLIKAFNKLRKMDQFRDLKLILVGGVFLKKVENIDHPELESLKIVNRLISQNNLEEMTIRPGQVDTDDLIGFYNLATVYVQPSLYEGFGLPVLEAFSSGCPVISSGAASLPEVGGRAAVYFDPQNSDQLVKILSEVLLDKSLRSKLSKLGLNQAERFSWEKVADETVKVYEQVVNHGKV